jgi:hypothetical protein
LASFRRWALLLSGSLVRAVPVITQGYCSTQGLAGLPLYARSCRVIALRKVLQPARHVSHSAARTRICALYYVPCTCRRCDERGADAHAPAEPAHRVVEAPRQASAAPHLVREGCYLFGWIEPRGKMNGMLHSQGHQAGTCALHIPAPITVVASHPAAEGTRPILQAFFACTTQGCMCAASD